MHVRMRAPQRTHTHTPPSLPSALRRGAFSLRAALRRARAAAAASAAVLRSSQAPPFFGRPQRAPGHCARAAGPDVGARRLALAAAPLPTTTPLPSFVGAPRPSPPPPRRGAAAGGICAIRFALLWRAAHRLN
ncbi:hypothetical protein Rsub_05541 [Raphidocelis subcapitata]|uniref:Uncharacterized protein n=1 Tax=Raphidocelis subcapitata TaxID=307507 RepID=A0A2V0NYD1_9CHLO|nr:hypothetical protein Rsub_05541 [Raphidocelis subcapitata]|eukprot:GBF92339.1 hypothetical protein Rsub_05541 [Raphidocelis subcapitata]